MNEVKLEDGIYVEVFAIKNNQRYNHKIINVNDLTSNVTNGFMDILQDIILNNLTQKVANGAVNVINNIIK